MKNLFLLLILLFALTFQACNNENDNVSPSNNFNYANLETFNNCLESALSEIGNQKKTDETFEITNSFIDSITLDYANKFIPEISSNDLKTNYFEAEPIQDIFNRNNSRKSSASLTPRDQYLYNLYNKAAYSRNINEAQAALDTISLDIYTRKPTGYERTAINYLQNMLKKIIADYYTYHVFFTPDEEYRKSANSFSTSNSNAYNKNDFWLEHGPCLISYFCGIMYEITTNKKELESKLQSLIIVNSLLKSKAGIQPCKQDKS
ncbi:hypothetical protein [Aureibacter tunicatorum]|uniref:C-di-AMP phosphodiesterase-like protein n=1 Tax=Aureibacter tunicatorum TaxID=866807 RepID=A0AAE3XPI3_9BACT|nr:hypothetical protein [Aureibacter tunicatorum]MDR6239670.1 c-di-AMP phosphodiesterase-like protein [Aureibacter tunicatorum]BDD04146.1 hypothetical protein AUTU_16290 [Aureibacter tunicatorum]